jgi:uncharacterized membrane protein
MSYTVGDGMVVIGLAAGIVGYYYVKHQSRKQRLEIVHQERLVAMEKGIPLPEFPLEPERIPREADQTVLPILGIVLFSLSVGTMIVLRMLAAANAYWIAPLPLAFMGVGLLTFYFLKRDAGR